MRKILFLFLFAAFSACAVAQETRDPENNHVRLTLTDGSTVEGYVQTYWVDGKLFKRMNTSFTLSPAPDGNNAVSYSADNVRSIDFMKRRRPAASMTILSRILWLIRRCLNPRKPYGSLYIKKVKTKSARCIGGMG